MSYLSVSVLSVLVVFATFTTPSAAGERAVPTDVNLITAIDVSGSIDPQTEAFQLESMAAAVVHPTFVEAIARGYYQRIGFNVFTWSSQGGFSMIVPWAIIDSAKTARSVAQQIQSVLAKSRHTYSTPAPSSAFPPWRRGLSTDVSAAINLAVDWLVEAPFPSPRQVINICANGSDNVAAGPEIARTRALNAGTVVNGLIIGDHPDVAAYYRERVQGGPGSFVIEARQFDDILDAMLTKFLLDLVMQTPEDEQIGSRPAVDQLSSMSRDLHASRSEIELSATGESS